MSARVTFVPSFPATFGASAPDQEFGGIVGLAGLPWVAGKHRYWWHGLDTSLISVNTDGTGGTPALSDPVGAMLTAATGDMLTDSLLRLPYAGGTVTRVSNAVRLGFNGFMYCNNMSSSAAGGNDSLAASFEAASGMTMAMRVKFSASNLTEYGMIGWDTPASTKGILFDTAEQVTYGGASTYGTPLTGLNSYKNVICVMNGGNASLYIDSTTATETTGGHAGTCHRFWAYKNGAGTTMDLQGVFMAAQAFTAEADLQRIFDYLNTGVP